MLRFYEDMKGVYWFTIFYFGMMAYAGLVSKDMWLLLTSLPYAMISLLVLEESFLGFWINHYDKLDLEYG